MKAQEKLLHPRLQLREIIRERKTAPHTEGEKALKRGVGWHIEQENACAGKTKKPCTGQKIRTRCARKRRIQHE